jgi:hypothetical protein
MMKVLAPIVVAAHGIGFTMWFLAAWVPGISVTPTPGHALLADDIAITSPIGKVAGLVSLAVVVGFLLVALGMFTGASWWPALAVVTAVISTAIVVVSWWSVVPVMSAIGALAVNALLIAFALVPAWNETLAH